jgi:hypothetical protein
VAERRHRLSLWCKFGAENFPMSEIRCTSRPLPATAAALARLDLLEVLKREPTADEIAARVQDDPYLRWLTGRA